MFPCLRYTRALVHTVELVLQMSAYTYISKIYKVSAQLVSSMIRISARGILLSNCKYTHVFWTYYVRIDLILLNLIENSKERVAHLPSFIPAAGQAILDTIHIHIRIYMYIIILQSQPLCARAGNKFSIKACMQHR